jgi:hydrogenase/urease accessory protein HupE
VTLQKNKVASAVWQAVWSGGFAFARGYSDGTNNVSRSTRIYYVTYFNLNKVNLAYTNVFVCSKRRIVESISKVNDFSHGETA